MAVRTAQRRIDRDGASTGPLLAAHVRESDGARLYEGIVAREGVLLYRRADGSTFRELVTLDTLRSMAGGLPRGPLTLEHPDEFVSPDNVGRYGVGDVDGELLIEENAQGAFARVKVAVRRRDAQTAIDGGKVELSPGYDVDVDETPGTHPVYGPYDGVQVARRVNHLAIVDRARGGPTVALRVDSGDAESIAPPSPGASMDPAALKALAEALAPMLAPLLIAGMAEVKAKGEAAEAAAQAGAAEQADAGATVPKAEYDTMKAELDAMKAAAAKVETAKMDSLALRHGVKLDAADALPAKRAKVAARLIPGITDAADPRIPGALAVLESQRADARGRYDGEPADTERRADSQAPAEPVNLHKAREVIRAGGAS
jgi:hypothetical protein